MPPERSPHPAARRRSLELDALRGIAVLLVLFRHPVLAPSAAGFLSPVAALLHRFGWTGVDLFFVLSGYLIGGLLFNEWLRDGRLDAPRFLLRRAFKIYPGYVALIACAIAVFIRHEPGGPRRALLVFWPNYLHVQNYFNSPQGHTWTLALEEHFYLALPFLLLILSRRGRMSWVPAVSIGVMLTCTALRFSQLRRPFDAITHLSPTHLRADSLFCGVLLSYLSVVRPAALAPLTRRPRLTLAAGLAMLLPMAWFECEHPFVWTIGFALLYVGYGCVLLGVVTLADRREMTPSPVARTVVWMLATVGFYSYSIYLWHPLLALAPVAYRLHTGMFRGLPPELRWACGMGVYLGIAVLAGGVMALLIERPMLALRERLFPARSRAISENQDAP